MEKKLNLPNLLSAFRLLMFPILIYFIYTLQERAFAWLFMASLFSDIADGYLARKLNMVTPFGFTVLTLLMLLQTVAVIRMNRDGGPK